MKMLDSISSAEMRSKSCLIYPVATALPRMILRTFSSMSKWKSQG